MSCTWALAATLLAIGHVVGLQCSADSILKKYSLEKVIHVKSEKNTPPSTTTQEWYINICDANREGAPSDCNGDDIVCGLQWAKLPDQDPILLKAIHVNASNYKDQWIRMRGSLSLSFKDILVGNDYTTLDLRIRCDPASEEDVFIAAYSFVHTSYSYIEFKGPSGCVTKEYDDGHANEPYEERHHSGLWWFLGLLICLILFALIGFVVVSYLNTKGGSFQDFREDFSNRTRTFIDTLASFIREVASKIFNRGLLKGQSSDRGGYSAM